MNHPQIDAKQLLQAAIQVLENRANDKREEQDENILLGLEILRQHEPVIQVSRPITGEPSESDRSVINAWQQLVPPEISAHTTPTGFSKGTLWVAVDSHAWLSEIVHHWRKPLSANLKASLPPGTLKTISFRYEPALDVHFEFVLPQPLYDRSGIRQGSWQTELDPGDGLPAQEWVREALTQAAKGACVDASFRLAPSDIPKPSYISVPKDQHFLVCEAEHTLEVHYFGQLHLDLDCVATAIKGAEREGVSPLTACANAFRSIAGKRWSRFKAAQEAGNAKEAFEMHAFGHFWYRLADQIEPRRSEQSIPGPKPNDRNSG